MASCHEQGPADGQLSLISVGQVISEAQATREGAVWAQSSGRDLLGLLTSTMQLSILVLLA